MKQFIVLLGNFGSGKTEIALNLAFSAAKTRKVTFVDLDIINPYFRSTERKTELNAADIRLISPNFVSSGVEVPSLPAEVYSVFSDSSDLVIFDLGGDPAGAIALGQYKRFFNEVSNLNAYYVINIRRPLSSTIESNLDMLSKISFACRLKLTGIVNNTNLSHETSLQELIDGYSIVASLS